MIRRVCAPWPVRRLVIGSMLAVLATGAAAAGPAGVRPIPVE